MPSFVPLLTLSGAARDRGRQHGEALRTRIRELLLAWEEDIAHDTGTTLDHYLVSFERDTSFLPAIRELTPGLLEEVEGIADGASIPLRTCLALQCMDQHWTHMAGLTTRTDRCSTAAVAPAGDHPTRLAQNMDLPKFVDGFQVLLKIEDGTGPSALVVTYPGFIGLFGVNDSAVGLCVNAISQLPQARRGLPVAFVVRSVLERSSAAEAEEWLAGIAHASGQSYLVGDRRRIAGLECCCEGVAWLPAEARWVCHTNHPLSCSLRGPAHERWDDDRNRANEAHALTFDRLDAMERAVGEGTGAEGLWRGLRQAAHRVNGAYPTFTFCAAVMELGSRVCMHVRWSPEEEYEPETYGF